MSATDLSTLHDEIRRLECRNDKLDKRQRVGVLVLASLLLMAMAGPQAPQTKVLSAERVEAKEFLIRDKSGVRLNLKLQKDGSVGIFLRDRSGKERLALHAQSDGLAGLVLQDATGKERLSALSQRDGLTGLFLADTTGKERFSMITQPDGLAALYAYDKKGKERVSAMTQTDGLGGVFVTDSDGETLHSFAK